MRDRTVQVLDRVGGAQRTRERAIDPEALHGERFIHAFAKRPGRAQMLASKRAGKPLELAQREHGVVAIPGVAQGATHARAHVLGQMLQDVAHLVHLAALHSRRFAEDIADRAAQGFGAVDHPQPRPFGIEQRWLADQEKQAA